MRQEITTSRLEQVLASKKSDQRLREFAMLQLGLLRTEDPERKEPGKKGRPRRTGLKNGESQ
jgi:hypothetical protein